MQALGLDADALKEFHQLRRISLKNNFISSLPASVFPSTLSYLDLSSNPNLESTSFLKGLVSLTTLILSDCTKIGSVFDPKSEDFKDCASLKVLVMDHCGFSGELNLKKASFAKSLETLIVSHNDIQSINLKHVGNLKKLSASNNGNLQEVKHLESRVIAEIRLANCIKLRDVHFLSKNQRKLALLDLSGCEIVHDWSALQKRLCVESLLTLSLKGTPLRKQYSDRESFEEACLKAIGCKKLRTLDFAKITARPNVESNESDGEDFDVAASSGESESEASEPEAKSAEEKESLKIDDAEKELADKQHKSLNKKMKIDDDSEGLFRGVQSAW